MPLYPRRSLELLACWLALPAAALAATASLVADLNTTGPNEQMQVFSPGLSLGDRVVFNAFERSTGRELWVSDGTVLGTKLLRDLCPGGCSGDPNFPLGRLGRNAVFFAGRDEVFSHENELWVTDGTRRGTIQLTAGGDDDPHATCSFLSGRVVSSYLYFGASRGRGSDCGLWRTDGTPEGTILLFTVGRFGRVEVAGLGTTAYLLAQGADQGDGLLRSDGTPAGTIPVKALENGRQLTLVGNRLFFLAEANGDELWTSDGTSQGTRAITQFAVAQPFDSFGTFFSRGGTLYFLANDGVNGTELWQSDGTASGTRRVTDLAVAEPFRFSSFEVAQLCGRLLFVANGDSTGFRLWTSEGTPATTQPLTSCPGGCPRVSEDTSFAVLAGKALFRGHDPQHGIELWASDGTGAGTHRVHELCPGACSGLPEGLTLLHGQVWFEANAGDGASVWRTDGTAQGTVRLVNASRVTPQVPIVTIAAEAAGKVFFVAATKELGSQLWASDGTPKGTGLVTRFQGSGPSATPETLTRLGQDLLFWACDGTQGSLWRSGAGGLVALPASTGNCVFRANSSALVLSGNFAFFRNGAEQRLWRTDGTTAGTFALGPVAANSMGEPVAWGANKVAFLAVLDFRSSLWESDGTLAGTRNLIDLPVEIQAEDLQSVGGKLYFRANSVFGEIIWVSDGTFAGTRRLTSRPISFARPRVTPVGNTTYILFADAVLKTDGTPEGTVTVRELPGHVIALSSASFVDFAGALYFTALGAGSRGLWRSDGTAEGTVLVRILGSDADPFVPEPALFTPLGAALFFVADDGVHGRELWRTDGTTAGTFMVRDILPGSKGSSPSSLVAAGGRLYFSAGGAANGRELWTSDGTAAGTHLVQDIAPEELSADPRELTVVGDELFFSADDGLSGRELWVYPLDAPPGCVASETELCLSGGVYQITAQWLDFSGNRGPGRAVPLTADTGAFWFFDPANVEVILKVLDGEALNGHRWVFYGALSSVEYTLTVTDTQTGTARRYFNLLGRLSSVADTSAFGPNGAHAAGLSLGPQAAGGLSPFVHRAAVEAEPCAPSSNRVCLNGGRFAVEARWKDFAGNTGTAGAVPLAGGDTAYFWFFNPDNVEVVLKVLDGRPVNGKFWVFYGALSTVEYTLTVTDTETGEVRTFTNPAGRLASVAETGAF